MPPINAVDCRAAAAGGPLVARRYRIIEISAACSLQQVPAGGGHIAQLLRGTGPDCAGNDRVLLLNQRVVREVAVWHKCADPHTAASCLLYSLERQSRDVDQQGGALDIPFHQVEQVCAASDKFGGRVCADLLHGVCNVACPRIMKIDHGSSTITDIACLIAATMLG